MTLNSCDVYCCCDQDCNIDIRNFWKENYNEYCAKNTIMKQYKPYSQCIDANVMAGYNSRMGMQASELNNRLCISLDVGSVFSTYKEEVKTYT